MLTQKTVDPLRSVRTEVNYTKNLPKFPRTTVQCSTFSSMRLFRLGLSLLLRGECLLMTLRKELLGGIENHKQLVARLVTVSGVEKVFERHGAFESGNDKNFLFLRSSHPIGEFQGVRNGRAQKHDVHVLREHDQNFLPNDATFTVDNEGKK